MTTGMTRGVQMFGFGFMASSLIITAILVLAGEAPGTRWAVSTLISVGLLVGLLIIGAIREHTKGRNVGAVKI